MLGTLSTALVLFIYAISLEMNFIITARACQGNYLKASPLSGHRNREGDRRWYNSNTDNKEA